MQQIEIYLQLDFVTPQNGLFKHERQNLYNLYPSLPNFPSFTCPNHVVRYISSKAGVADPFLVSFAWRHGSTVSSYYNCTQRVTEWHGTELSIPIFEHFGTVGRMLTMQYCCRTQWPSIISSPRISMKLNTVQYDPQRNKYGTVNTVNNYITI